MILILSLFLVCSPRVPSLPFFPASRCILLRLATTFPSPLSLSRWVPWHRTQDRGDRVLHQHTWSTLTSCGTSPRKKEKSGEGEGGRVIDRCDGGRGMQLQPRGLYPLLYHRDCLCLVLTRSSSSLHYAGELVCE